MQVLPVPQAEASLSGLTTTADGPSATFDLVVQAQSNTGNASFGHAQVTSLDLCQGLRVPLTETLLNMLLPATRAHMHSGGVHLVWHSILSASCQDCRPCNGLTPHSDA